MPMQDYTIFIVADTSHDTHSTVFCSMLYYFWTNILLCTRILGTSSLLYKTTDGGVSWTSVSDGLPTTYDFTFHAISVGTYAHVHNVDIEIRIRYLREEWLHVTI